MWWLSRCPEEFEFRIMRYFPCMKEKECIFSSSNYALLYSIVTFCSDQMSCKGNCLLGCALFSLTNNNLVQLELLIKLWHVRESRANRNSPK